MYRFPDESINSPQAEISAGLNSVIDSTDAVTSFGAIDDSIVGVSLM